MSTQILTELPRIQQAGMDFETVMAEIRDIIKNNPNWATNWPEFYDSEAGVMLTQLMAWVTDNMSTRQDVLVNEMFLSTAQDDRNKLKLLKQIAYNPGLANAAKVAVRIDFSEMPDSYTYITPPRTNIENRINEILKFNSKDINGASIPWEILSITDGKPNYLESVTLKPGEVSYTIDKNNNTIYALQGETKYEEFTTDTSDGSFFDLKAKNIAAESIQVYVKKSMMQLLEVSSFVNKDALDKEQPYPYVIETNTDRTLRIRFGNKSILKKERLLPAGTTISVFYRTTSGSVGNINPGFMNASVTVTDDNKQTWSATIANDLLANGGTDEETIDDAKLNGPLSLRTMDRAVTPPDYNIIVNRNPNVFKSKTYTSTNQPDGFINYYGRYINPQEAFTILMLNKNYKNVPVAEYNNFPWFTSTKEPRLNEKYLFDKGDYDSTCGVSPTYYNMSIVQKDSSVKTFRNATIVSLSDEFNNALYRQNGDENELLKLKLSVNKTTESFFDNIKFDLLYPNNKDFAKRTFLTMKNNFISSDDNARFITATSFDSAKPIDVNKARYITVSFDNKPPMTIDLWVDRGKIQNDDGTSRFPSTEYYLLWDNVGDLTAKSVWGTNKTMAAAIHRNGIVNIINDSIAALISGGDDGYELYGADTSLQYFGMNLIDENSPIAALTNLTSIWYTLEVNSKKYRFNLSQDVYQHACNADGTEQIHVWNSLKGVEKMLNYIFTTNQHLQTKEGSKWVAVSDGFPLGELEAKVMETYNFDTDSDANNDVGFESVYSSYDLVIKTNSLNMLVNKAYTDQDGFSHELKNVIWLDDFSEGDNRMFIHTLKGNNSSAVPARKLIQEPTQAANYENLASFEPISDESADGFFKLVSPIKGNASSVMFKYTPTVSNASGGDFMKEVLNIYFNNAGFSYKAYGVKRAYLVKNNTLRNYIVQNGVETTLDVSVNAGNVIFENSCIYNGYDFSKVYANYKIAKSDSLVLGSVYDNFYYSGIDLTDELLKTEISGITGQYMGSTVLANGVKSYYIDENKTDLDIRFTSTKQETNSLYSIKQDLDIVKSDKIVILTDSIKEHIGGGIKLRIDNNQPFFVDLQECRSGTSMTAAIIKVLRDLEATSALNNNRNTIARDSFLCLNQVQLQNLNKNNGSFTFMYPLGLGLSEDVIKKTHKVIFGTNKTNETLYNLYPAEMFDNDNVIHISEDEYYYCPTQDKELTFTYRKLVEEVNDDGTVSMISRPADYYVTIEGSAIGNQNKYRFLLNKTENSKFPDTFFYVHFINDRAYEFDETGKVVETDENVLQKYMDKYKLSGSNITFIKPYFRPYDVAATIKYNANFQESEVVQAVNEAVDNLCKIEKAEIAGDMSRAKILKAIMNVDGVEDCKITYFGYNYSSGAGSVDTLTADFYEILCLNDTDGSSTGKIFTFEMLG